MLDFVPAVNMTGHSLSATASALLLLRGLNLASCFCHSSLRERCSPRGHLRSKMATATGRMIWIAARPVSCTLAIARRPYKNRCELTWPSTALPRAVMGEARQSAIRSIIVTRMRWSWHCLLDGTTIEADAWRAYVSMPMRNPSCLRLWMNVTLLMVATWIMIFSPNVVTTWWMPGLQCGRHWGYGRRRVTMWLHGLMLEWQSYADGSTCFYYVGSYVLSFISCNLLIETKQN